MNLRTFYGKDVPGVAAAAREALGEDAMIVRTRVLRTNGSSRVEVVAIEAHELQRFRALLAGKPLPTPLVGADGGAFVVALVGPPGAGKTTALAKLALHRRGLGRHSVGVLTLDTFRMGAVEQIETFCEAADLPLEVAYEPADVNAALDRLGGKEVILIDTPGRVPDEEDWRELLDAASPDEIHLVVPATCRPDVAIAARRLYGRGATHQLISQLDLVPGEEGVGELASAIDLPARWIADGYSIPTDFGEAPDRLVAALSGPVASP